MIALFNWAARIYTLIKIAKFVSESQHRTSQQTVEAAVDKVNNTKAALVSLYDSTGASLTSAKQNALNGARQQAPLARSVNTALLGSVGTEAMRIGSWHLHEDENGDLIGKSDDGRTVNLTEQALRPSTLPDVIKDK